MGRIDVHAHLLPGIDDGCPTLDDSLACARRLVEYGYSDCCCTPHIWSNLPHNDRARIAQRTRDLQGELDRAGIALALHPGGEINLRTDVGATPPEDVVTYGLRGRHVLIDLWAERLPPHFEPSVRWFQGLGLTVVLAHPERMRAVQDDPSVVDQIVAMGVMLQGNFQCFNDPPHMRTRIVVERFLSEGRYFMLGTDLHGTESLGTRLSGFDRARALVDAPTFDRLTIHNPRTLLGV